MYNKYIGRRFYMAFFCGIAGFFLTYYLIVTAIRNFVVTTNDAAFTYTKL
jgi:hypothetical protein